MLQEYENIRLRLGASVVANLVTKPPAMQISNSHIVMDNYFPSPVLLRHLSEIGDAAEGAVRAKGAVRANRMKNAPLRDMVKMNKKRCGSSDVFTDLTSKITTVPCKDNKTVTAISTFTGNHFLFNSGEACPT